MKPRDFLFGVVLFACLLPADLYAQHNVVNVTDREIPQGVLKQIAAGKKVIVPGSPSSGANWGKGLSVVKLSGKTNHFGIDITTGEYIDYWATVPGVKVWMPEYPSTRDLHIETDDTGWWTAYVVKYAGVDAEFSVIYEKAGWVTTKSNVITVTDQDDLDLAIQYIDPAYFQYAMKPWVEYVFLGGAPFRNAMVVTVGKSWASMHDERLPHGDPDARTIATPSGGVGPVYFNEDVFPDPTQLLTSLDGGVAWLNLPVNTYHVTAVKDGVSYPTVRFRVEAADATERGVLLYIASPPDSLEGSNSSGPGEP